MHWFWIADTACCQTSHITHVSHAATRWTSHQSRNCWKRKKTKVSLVLRANSNSTEATLHQVMKMFCRGGEPETHTTRTHELHSNKIPPLCKNKKKSLGRILLSLIREKILQVVFTDDWYCESQCWWLFCYVVVPAFFLS